VFTDQVHPAGGGGGDGGFDAEVLLEAGGGIGGEVGEGRGEVEGHDESGQ
jgi:hypothetical protein